MTEEHGIFEYACVRDDLVGSIYFGIVVYGQVFTDNNDVFNLIRQTGVFISAEVKQCPDEGSAGFQIEFANPEFLITVFANLCKDSRLTRLNLSHAIIKRRNGESEIIYSDNTRLPLGGLGDFRVIPNMRSPFRIPMTDAGPREVNQADKQHNKERKRRSNTKKRINDLLEEDIDEVQNT